MSVPPSYAGEEFYQCRKPRWESLHAIQGIAQLYWLTGEKSYRTAFERLWWSIVKLDRHNNGGFSAGEQAQGNPYHPGAIETCCTVAWIAMSVDMLRMTGNSLVADELELSTLNQVLGYQHPSGKWCTYNTPMDGRRRKSVEEIGFQIRPGSEEINCCSANAPRGFGMIAQWALMSDGRGLVVNWYGQSTMMARLSGTEVTLEQQTDYPRDGRILVKVSPKGELRFPLKMRIPGWSAQTRVEVNGQAVANVRPGAYLVLDRTWKPGDSVRIDIDMSLHYWVGERECAGKVSIYRGPLLLIREVARTKEADRFLELGVSPAPSPVLDAVTMNGHLVATPGVMRPLVVTEVTTVDGTKVRLRDYGTAFEDGLTYASWLTVRNVSPTAVFRDKPVAMRSPGGYEAVKPFEEGKRDKSK